MEVVQRGLKRWALRTELGQRARDAWRRIRARRGLREALDGDPPYQVSIEHLIGVVPAFLVGDEATTLSRYAASAPRAVVELGAGRGGSSAVLLASLAPRARLWSIDPFVQDSMGDWAGSEHECRQNVLRFLRAVEKEQVAERWTLVAKPSYEVVKTWNEKIDMLFIDGDHRYEAVRKDFEDWFPHVEEGGILILHDSRRVEGTPPDTWHLGFPGPTQLAEELRQRPDIAILDETDSMTVWRRATAT